MADQEPSDGWGKVTKIILGLTSVLVVIPSLINSAKDIYDEINEVPRTDAERANVEFFRKYWGKKPVGELPLVITRGGASYQVSFNVYDEGDIYIQYGNMVQWFAFPGQSNALGSNLDIISVAHADGVRYQSIGGEIKQIRQIDSFDGRNAVREKFYINGMRERQVIDIRTGVIVDQTLNQGAVPPPESLPSTGGPSSVTIDLNSPDPKFELFH